MVRFIVWTLVGIVAGFAAGAALHDMTGYNAQSSKGTAIGLGFAACTLAGAIGGATHEVLHFMLHFTKK